MGGNRNLEGEEMNIDTVRAYIEEASVTVRLGSTIPLRRDAIAALDAMEAEMAELRNLRDNILRCGECKDARAEAAQEQKEFTERWYEVRFQRLADYAKEHGFWGDVAAIFANGRLMDDKPPTYAQQLNAARNRVEVLEEEVKRLQGNSNCPIYGSTDTCTPLQEQERKIQYLASMLAAYDGAVLGNNRKAARRKWEEAAQEAAEAGWTPEEGEKEQ